MKVLAAALAALFLLAICSSADSGPVASFQKQGIDLNFCCFTYMHRRVPRRSITSAYVTSSKCTQPAVILVTKKGTAICTDPQDPWVQNYLKHFQTLKN